MFDFAKEMHFDETALGNKSTRDESLIRLLKSPSIMIFASSVSSSHKKKSFLNTRCLSSDPYECCDRLKLLLQEQQAGNNSNIINEENYAIADKLLEYKCISTERQKILLIKCLN